MRHKKLIAGVVVAVLLIAGAAAVYAMSNSLGETAAGDVRDGPASAPAARVVMHDDTFDPTSATVPTGSAVEIELRNDGQANHNFTSDALKVSTGPMKTGDVKTVTVTLPAGTTSFKCTWHPGMTIDLTAG